MKKIFCISASIILGIVTVILLLQMFSGITIAVANMVTGEIHVCPTGCDYEDVQSAVNAAGQGDIIKVAVGVYSDVHSFPSPSGYSGSNVITQVVFISKTVTVRGGYTTSDWETSNPEANPTVLKAQGNSRVVFIAGEVEPALEGFILIEGNANGLGGSGIKDSGGGVYVISATATIRDNYIYSNTAHIGSGVYINKANASLIGNTIQQNNADPGFGGGAYIKDSNVVFSENIIQMNNVGSYGGGIGATKSIITLTNNTVISNTGRDGGGISMWYSVGTLINNTISHNTASDEGGGVILKYGDTSLVGNIINANRSGDTAGGGGGLIAWEGTLLLERNSIVNNTSNSSGGGIFLYGVYPAMLIRNQINGNSARTIGGGANLTRCEVTLLNNEIISNTTMEGGGGGLWLYEGDIKITGNTIQGNITMGGRGGGFRMLYGHGALVTNNLITRNSTVQNGGGLAIEDSLDVTLSGNEITDNIAGIDGGGVFSKIHVASDWANNVFLRNQAGNTGGAMSLSISNLNLLHNTIAHNYGGDGSGISLAGRSGGPAYLNMTNTILVSQTVGIIATSEGQVTINGILWFENTENTGGSGTFILSNEQTGNPYFTSDCYHLSENSKAINAGIPSGLKWDIDSEPRPYEEYDLGADEFYPVGVLKFIYLPLVKH